MIISFYLRLSCLNLAESFACFLFPISFFSFVDGFFFCVVWLLRLLHLHNFYLSFYDLHHDPLHDLRHRSRLHHLLPDRQFHLHNDRCHDRLHDRHRLQSWSLASLYWFWEALFWLVQLQYYLHEWNPVLI